LSDHIMILGLYDGSVPRPNVTNQQFSMRLENFIETSH